MNLAWTVKTGDGQLLVYCLHENKMTAMRLWLASNCGIVMGPMSAEQEIRRVFNKAANAEGAKVVGVELVERKR